MCVYTCVCVRARMRVGVEEGGGNCVGVYS